MSLKPIAIDTIMRDGTVIRSALTHGACKDMTLLLLHGFGEGGYIWECTRDVLGSVWSIVVPDLRGHGDSGRSRSGRYDLDLYIDDVLSVIDQLRLERIGLIGHSMGGRIAAYIATRRPARAVALALLDTNLDNPSAKAIVCDGFQRNLRRYACVNDYAEWLLSTRPLLSERMANMLAQGALRKCEAGFELKVDPAIIDGYDEQQTSGNIDFSTLLELIRCPSIVIRGIGSAILNGQSAKEMAVRLRSAVLVSIQNSGHGVVTDNPISLNQILYEFILGINRAR
jgi:pimeloyl-ACP methyl ester carboxylesterase